MKDREIIAEAVNTPVPAILALQEVGFAVERRSENGNNPWSTVSTDLELMSEHSFSYWAWPSCTILEGVIGGLPTIGLSTFSTNLDSAEKVYGMQISRPSIKPYQHMGI